MFESGARKSKRENEDKWNKSENIKRKNNREIEKENETKQILCERTVKDMRERDI